MAIIGNIPHFQTNPYGNCNPRYLPYFIFHDFHLVHPGTDCPSEYIWVIWVPERLSELVPLKPKQVVLLQRTHRPPKEDGPNQPLRFASAAQNPLQKVQPRMYQGCTKDVPRCTNCNTSLGAQKNLRCFEPRCLILWKFVGSVRSRHCLECWIRTKAGDTWKKTSRFLRAEVCWRCDFTESIPWGTIPMSWFGCVWK